MCEGNKRDGWGVPKGSKVNLEFKRAGMECLVEEVTSELRKGISNQWDSRETF